MNIPFIPFVIYHEPTFEPEWRGWAIADDVLMYAWLDRSSHDAMMYNESKSEYDQPYSYIFLDHSL